MRRTVPSVPAALLLMTVLFTGAVTVQSRTDDSAREISEAVDSLLSSLSDSQRHEVVVPFSSDVRTHWFYVPDWLQPRHGLNVGELTDTQRDFLHRLLQVSLSDRGYLKAIGIMSLDDILRGVMLARLDAGEDLGVTREQAQQFGSEHYWFALFHDPNDTTAWAWRFEGHHLSLNFTIAGGLVVGTPEFMGADPARVPTGPRAGFEVLAAERSLGRRLILSLTAAQNRLALLNAKTPQDIITGPRGVGRLDSIRGIAASDLRASQQQLLRAIIGQYVTNLREDLAANESRAMEKAGFGRVHFAWAGSVEQGRPFYYRVHGPTLVIEFDNTDDDPNHVHSVWHGQDDFGADLLRRHYQQDPDHRH